MRTILTMAAALLVAGASGLPAQEGFQTHETSWLSIHISVPLDWISLSDEGLQMVDRAGRADVQDVLGDLAPAGVGVTHLFAAGTTAPLGTDSGYWALLKFIPSEPTTKDMYPPGYLSEPSLVEGEGSNSTFACKGFRLADAIRNELSFCTKTELLALEGRNVAVYHLTYRNDETRASGEKLYAYFPGDGIILAAQFWFPEGQVELAMSILRSIRLPAGM